MSAPLSPIVIAQIVARNVVPLAGVLFLHWHASNVLLLYFLDTMLAIAVMFVGLMGAIPRYAPSLPRIGPVRAFAAAIVLCGFFAIPMGAPLLILLSVNDVHWRDVLADSGLRTGAIIQAAAAYWSYRDFERALRDHSPEELRVKRRFALVFLRWVGVLMVMYTGLGMQLPVLVIAAYIAISIWEEIAPDRFLRSFGDVQDVDTAPAQAKQSRHGKRDHSR